MSVPKLYRHNENGKIVAAVYKENDTGDKEYIRFDGTRILFDSGLVPKKFEEVYTPLPEAPEVGSTAWAVWMLNSGEKLENPTEVHGNYIYKVMDEVCFADGWVFRDFQNYLFKPNHTWRLYEEPKPIVELLPHEFVEGQEVLVRDDVSKKWCLHDFTYYDHGNTEPFNTTCHSHIYCIPYAGNEYLEGAVTDGEHGAVPKGYVPPHVPKLGDEDYWYVGDKIINLSNGDEGVVVETLYLNNALHVEREHDCRVITLTFDGVESTYDNKPCMRVWYHKDSYVKEDGTVHEHIPTRSYYITQK